MAIYRSEIVCIILLKFDKCEHGDTLYQNHLEEHQTSFLAEIQIIQLL